MIILSLLLAGALGAASETPNCAPLLHPREIDAGAAFDRLVDWVEEELVVRRRAPGLVVGVSGTDSILAFLAVAEAYARVGRPERAVALHFGPADGRGWFQEEIMPWLKARAPGALVFTDASFDHRRDGLRWGALLDWSVLTDPTTGAMRAPEDRYWVVGTRNRSEAMLGTYSNLSRAASVQPLTSLWKSEVLQICRHLAVPAVALDQSCVADCTCGREQFPALHIPEVDALLMERAHELEAGWSRRVIGADLFDRLNTYVEGQIGATGFKAAPPHEFEFDPQTTSPTVTDDELAEMQKLMADPKFSGRSLAPIVPRIVREGRANVAASLVTASSSDPDRWLGEAMVLMNTPGLRPSQRRRMIERIYGVSDLDTAETFRVARLTARLANYGYSFARWRFLFKRFDHRPSLAERWQFRAVARDHAFDLGAGFELERGPWHVEFRQAYVAVTHRGDDGPITLLIRNNSTVFGRDQIYDAAYVAWSAITPAEMKEVTADRLLQDRRAVVFSKFLLRRPDLARKDKIDRILKALDWLRALEGEFDAWLKGPEGFPALVETLRFATEHHPVWLGVTNAEDPPWSPKDVRPVTRELLEELARHPSAPDLTKSHPADLRLTLLNGAKGDFP